MMEIQYIYIILILLSVLLVTKEDITIKDVESVCSDAHLTPSKHVYKYETVREYVEYKNINTSPLQDFIAGFLTTGKTSSLGSLCKRVILYIFFWVFAFLVIVSKFLI